MKKRIMALLTALALCLALLPTAAFASGRDTSAEEHMAAGLKQLGLFQGVSENDFALLRAPNRDEALVMLIRILGKESEALTGTWRHPFTDVADWANKYVGYAYQNGLTNGISPTLFGSGAASATMYLTFVLRALGYSDANGTDFTWDNPFDLARQVGILTDGVDLNDFWRADVARVSYSALPAKLKGTSQTLAEKLIAAGVFTKAQYEAVYGKSGAEAPPSAPTVADGQAIYQQCSPAVFYIETWDVDGQPYAYGSGFFISSDGIAVTNHHVLENALSATATTSDGQEHTIEGVLYFDDALDYAVIKVSGSGFPTLTVGDSSTVSSGERVYAIGNPKGLTNTISDGIISSPSREDYNGMMQTTVPISSGSSGGALLNSQGQVIGITTASRVDGQNLNFAVPIHFLELDTSVPKYRSDVLTMAEYAKYNEYLIYDNLPEPYDVLYGEGEPNGTLELALPLDNGDTVEGQISGEEMDVFTIHCNTVGSVEVLVYSDAPAQDVQRLMLSIYPAADKDARGVYAEYDPGDDGESFRYLRYVVNTPGVYALYLFPYFDKGVTVPNMDYVLYYCFTPGDTSGENTDGLSQLIANGYSGSSSQGTGGGYTTANSAQRRQEAYEALKTWVTSAGSSCYDEVSVSDSGAEIMYRVAVSNSLLELGYFYTLNNLMIHVKLDLPPTSDWAQSTVSVFKHDDWDNNVSAAVNVSIPEFCADYNYWFYHKLGPANEISYYERLGKDVCLDLLDFANHVLSDCMHTDYTVGDFGYTAF